MPRKKKTVLTEDVKGTQQVIPTEPAVTSSLDPVLNPSVDSLLEEYGRNDDWITAQEKAFAEHMKPIRDRNESIKSQLHAKLLEMAGDQPDGTEKATISTAHGTAYLSNILNTKIDADGAAYRNSDGQEVRGREAVLDFCLDHWDEIGNEMLQVGATKDAVKQWIEKTGAPPPGITTSNFQRVNIRRS